MPLTPHNQQLFKVSLASEGGSAPVSSVFASNLSGQGWARDTEEYGDPDASFIRLLIGFVKLNDVTLTSLYDPSQVELLTWLQGQKTTPTRFTCILQPIDASLDANPVGAAITMSGCQAISASYPEMDRDSVGTSKVTLTFRPEDIA